MELIRSISRVLGFLSLKVKREMSLTLLVSLALAAFLLCCGAVSFAHAEEKGYGFHNPHFSADGKLLAFDLCRNDSCESVVHNIEANTEIELSAGDEVLTYVARNLEPYRGFPSFMRSLPAILSARPKAQVVVIGGDETSYGAPLPEGQTYRRKMLDELGDSLDTRRVHFLGKVPYPVFLKALQVSRVHVYLTYPFVLSWSMLEAMSAGCLVVGSRTAPVEEVIRDGENGVLADFFKPEEIAAQVVLALAEPEQFATLRTKARQTIIDNYDLKRVCLPEQIGWLEQLASR